MAVLQCNKTMLYLLFHCMISSKMAFDSLILKLITKTIFFMTQRPVRHLANC